MVYKVVFLRQAEFDLIELKKYVLENFSNKTWLTCYSNIKKVVNSLVIFPESGNIPPEITELNLNHYRQIISGKNRIIYEVSSSIIFIHIICDARKDMVSLLMKRLLADS